MTTTDSGIVFPEADWQEATPESQGLDSAKLDQAMRQLDEITLDQGTSQSLVIRNGRLLWQGPDIDNKHTVWSCSKSFLSSTLGLLVDDGKCTLDSVAADFLPPLAEHYPTVTLRQFANFTSGYAGQVEEPSEEVAHLIFEPTEPLYEPGTMFHYSQSSDQLANLLTRIAGEPLRDLYRRRIAEPIGMDPAGWSWGDWGEIDRLVVCGGSGSYEKGISITARQMARMGWLLANGGQWNGRRVLSREYVEEMTTPQVANTVPPYDGKAWYLRLPGSYGVNIWLNGLTPDGRRMWPDAPGGLCAIQGNMNNICFAVPEWNMVLVRLGTDGRIDNNRYTEVFAKLRLAIKD